MVFRFELIRKKQAAIVASVRALGQILPYAPKNETDWSMEENDEIAETINKKIIGMSSGLLVNTVLFSSIILTDQIRKPAAVKIRTAVNLLYSKNSVVDGRKNKGGTRAIRATVARINVWENLRKFSFMIVRLGKGLAFAW
ncbi:hypothetical protein A3A60_01260 [Candidatus Curtissbacteria bacterium RIFCSPLOWO2_01_FULL_42_26]|uniref:Uncharacterized protein n=1 Tax=Candidatus Curtissbacteria bacterium RIFCSPLOWO2_01_FULL_42_26 TaxID=1797729 RepID=A0A1F5HYA5_9BACT|nr:MAG: hypothetical protein A3A60_01260 [Candidatus Curtissbacteria bacterium RIFCSPLOWO2_01_FULL_42_26]